MRRSLAPAGKVALGDEEEGGSEDQPQCRICLESDGAYNRFVAAIAPPFSSSAAMRRSLAPPGKAAMGDEEEAEDEDQPQCRMCLESDSRGTLHAFSRSTFPPPGRVATSLPPAGAKAMPNSSTGRHCLGRHCLGRHCLGRHYLGRHCLGRHYLGRHYLGRNCFVMHYLGRHCLGRHCLGRHCLGRHCLGRHYLGRHYLGRHCLGRHYLGRHCLGRHCLVVRAIIAHATNLLSHPLEKVTPSSFPAGARTLHDCSTQFVRTHAANFPSHAPQTGHDLIAPCKCKGSARFVHRHCLDQWRATKEGFAFCHCSTCKTRFQLRVCPPPDPRFRHLKFRFFVARDFVLVTLLVQLLIISLGCIAPLSYDISLPRLVPTRCAVLLFLIFAGLFGDVMTCAGPYPTSLVKPPPAPLSPPTGGLLFLVLAGLFGADMTCAGPYPSSLVKPPPAPLSPPTGGLLFLVLAGLFGAIMTCVDRRFRSDLAAPCRDLAGCCHRSNV
ncbi:unnamed protein product [Closterium sp. Naga37s-1]|nr:unnamed protein product [Closterium sp. Naga37s-1]